MRPIPVPESLVLSNQVWTVIKHVTRRTFRGAQKIAGARGRKLFGFCAYAAREIHLAPHKTDRALGRTFLHELLHACGAEREDRGSKAEEEFVIHVEDPLATVIEAMLSEGQV